jgi:serine/threonine protein kinase
VAGYEVLGKLGHGGFGAVFLARCEGRTYALKFVRLGRPAQWAEREAEALRRLHHPNVVGFHGCVLWPEAEPQYRVLVMDAIPGQPLHEWVQRENPPVSRLLREVVLPTARALGAVHRAGVVHRDVKESNILMREEDGQPVLVDFGAAGYEGAPRLTSFWPPGTRAYLSPEGWDYFRIHVGETDAHYIAEPADDWWALGVSLYWMLTDELPFNSGDMMELGGLVLRSRPKPPHECNPWVPREVSGLCLRLLARNREERLVGEEAVCAAVEATLAQADASWQEPLFAGYTPDTLTTEQTVSIHEVWNLRALLKRRALQRPRRGQRPVPPGGTPTETAGFPSGFGESTGEPPHSASVESAPLPAPEPSSDAAPASPPQEAVVQRGLGRWVPAVACAVVGVALLLTLAWQPSAQENASTAPVMWAPPLPTPWTIPLQEVAPPWLQRDVEGAAAPRPAESTPAAVASPATPSQDEAPVKDKKKPSLKQKRLGSVAQACVGAAALANLACASAPVVHPPVLSAECPPGAVEVMTKRLGLRIGELIENVDLRSSYNPVQFITVNEGAATAQLSGTRGKLPANTFFDGSLHFGPDRVYGRFTQARLPGGETLPVCIELVAHTGGKGLKMKERTGPHTARVLSMGFIRPVQRFE